jgi:hypothetical protein
VLYKCANPSCENPFLKLTQGKLFLVETDEPHSNGSSLTLRRTSRRRIEHYWLCDGCAPILTLAYERGRGIVAVPLPAQPPKMPPATEFHTKLATHDGMRALHPYSRRA